MDSFGCAAVTGFLLRRRRGGNIRWRGGSRCCSRWILVALRANDDAMQVCVGGRCNKLWFAFSSLPWMCVVGTWLSDVQRQAREWRMVWRRVAVMMDVAVCSREDGVAAAAVARNLEGSNCCSEG